MLKTNGKIGRGKIAEAALLTLGAVGFIFGLGWFFAPEGDYIPDDRYYYQTWFSVVPILESSSTNRYSFEASEGQLFAVGVSAAYVQQTENDTGVNIPEWISVTITDPDGDIFWEEKNVQWAQTEQPLSVQKTGTYELEVVNHQDRPIQGGVTVTEYIRAPQEDYFYTFIMFLSLPVITLAVWLFIVRR